VEMERIWTPIWYRIIYFFTKIMIVLKALFTIEKLISFLFALFSRLLYEFIY
jgi:hypothetical protein